MNEILRRGFILALLSLAPVLVSPASAQDLIGGDDSEILIRGPIHEAFAEPVALNPGAGLVINRRPPQAIEELPPEQQIPGENVVWISGYWSWDDERNDFVWISGVWRVAPKGQDWVPGYWHEVRDGWQWVPGMWRKQHEAVAATEIDYMPPPPESLEAGPASPSPANDYFWVPGLWTWQQGRYVWRPGYWAQSYTNWVWVPYHYVWTPSGYVVAGGYWDWVLEQRGMVFAPVYFSPTVYARRDFYYSPRVVLNVGSLVAHLFIRPNYSHYYFGDYYGDHYSRWGYSPWCTHHRSRHGYDPLYTYYRHRNDRDWSNRLYDDYRHRHEHADARPPRRYSDFATLAARDSNPASIEPAVTRDRRTSRAPGSTNSGRRGDDDSPWLAGTLTKVAAVDPQVKLQRVDSEKRNELKKVAKDLDKFREQRRQTEAAPTIARPTTEAPKAVRLALPTSPVRSGKAAKVAAQIEDAVGRPVLGEQPVGVRPRFETANPLPTDTRKSDDTKTPDRKPLVVRPDRNPDQPKSSGKPVEIVEPIVNPQPVVKQPAVKQPPNSQPVIKQPTPVERLKTEVPPRAERNPDALGEKPAREPKRESPVLIDPQPRRGQPAPSATTPKTTTPNVAPEKDNRRLDSGRPITRTPKVELPKPQPVRTERPKVETPKIEQPKRPRPVVVPQTTPKRIVETPKKPVVTAQPKPIAIPQPKPKPAVREAPKVNRTPAKSDPPKPKRKSSDEEKKEKKPK